MNVVFCTATRREPHPAYKAALAASVPLLDAAGITHNATFRRGNPYISYVMADMLHRAMQTEADTFVFIDDDESWRPGDLVKLIETDGDVVAGTYRFKHEDDREEYMGSWHVDVANRAILRSKDRAIKAHMVPSGFLKITRQTVRKFMRAYPALLFGEPDRPAVDMFNHGVIVPNDGRWWGQDYAFSKRWADCGGNIWLVPDLSIDHHDWHSDRVWRGNLHEYLLRQPGGSKHAPASASVAPEMPADSQEAA